MNELSNLKRQRKKLRLEHFDYGNPNYVYFLTICARHLSSPFLNIALADAIVNSLTFIRKNKGICLYCYCLMPDHLHLVISPPKTSENVSDIMRVFKSYTTQIAWKHGVKGKLWQKSFYDHIARKDEDLNRICEYILANPVRKGLVERSNDWKYLGLLDPLPV